MRLLLGGAFDPPHQGHLHLAREARRLTGSREVLLVPSRLPPHKESPEAGPWDRYAMTALLCMLEEGLVPCPLELEREGTSFTVDTLEALAAASEQDPPRPTALIVGADMLADFPSWSRPERILELAALIAFPRHGCDTEGIVTALPPRLRERIVEGSPANSQENEPEAGAILLLSSTPPDVSSTELRQALAEGREPGDALPDVVADYIERRGLYRRRGEHGSRAKDPA